MRLWPFTRRPKSCPSLDAMAADAEASRALTDAKALTSRADRVADQLARTKSRNGFKEAVIYTFRGV